MSSAIIPISNLPALRGNSISADKVEQLRQYALASAGLAELADVIEEEARHTKTLVDDQATWDIAEGDFRCVCKLDAKSRAMLVTVHAGGYAVLVLRDDRNAEGELDVSAFTFNCPANARWPVFLKDQHELAQAKRAVATAQAERERVAQEHKRQSVI